MEPIPTSVHVCSLQTSAIKKIAQQAVEEAENGDKMTSYRLKWLNVAMEYNRQQQMQYVFANLGSKGKSPKFRAIRMRPFWHNWRREIIRMDWAEIRENVDRKMMIQDLSETTRYFESQRIELASRAFAKSPEIIGMPLGDILNIKPAKPLYTFQTPGSLRPGYYNQGFNYVESAALSTFSDVSDSEPQTDNVDPWDKPLEDEFVELAEKRGFMEPNKQENAAKTREVKPEEDENIDEPEPEKKETKPEQIQNEEPVKKEEIVEKSANTSTPKKNNTIFIIAAVIAAVLLAVAVFIAINHFKTPATPVVNKAPAGKSTPSGKKK